MQEGRVVNNRMTNYLIATALDAPPMDVAVVEVPYAYGPHGAKGVGEMPIDGVAPAVVAAIQDATGVFLDAIPVTPERLQQALEAKTGGQA